MSLSSLILALAPSIAARLKPKPSEVDALRASVQAELEDLRREMAELRLATAHPLVLIPPRPAGPDFRPPELAQLQAQQWAQAQQWRRRCN